jgi:hypothetical protein
MFLLYRQVGELLPDQLDFLVEHLEEEWPDDRDYFINRDLLKILEGQGADPALLTILQEALGERDEVDILWLDTEAQDDSMFIDLDQQDWDHEHIYGAGGELLHADGTSHGPDHDHDHDAEHDHDHEGHDHEHGPQSHAH